MDEPEVLGGLARAERVRETFRPSRSPPQMIRQVVTTPQPVRTVRMNLLGTHPATSTAEKLTRSRQAADDLGQ